MARKTAILISGRGSNMEALIRAAQLDGYPAEIRLVVSNRPEAAGLKTAAAADIATQTVDHTLFPEREAFEEKLNEVLEAANIELICLAGFMRLLTDSFVERWRDRMINIHPSLLPAFTGMDTHVRALEAGVRITGCTVHYVRAEMDSGPIVAQAAVPVLPDDEPDDLAARVLAAEHKLYPAALALVAAGRARVVNEAVILEEAGSSSASLICPDFAFEPDETADAGSADDLADRKTLRDLYRRIFRTV